MSRGQNIYQMWTDVNATGERLFVRRDSWSTGVAEILFVPDLVGVPPYYQSPPVLGLVWYRKGSGLQVQEITCPGTYAYTRIEQPEWWDKSRDARRWVEAFGRGA